MAVRLREVTQKSWLPGLFSSLRLQEEQKAVAQQFIFCPSPLTGGEVSRTQMQIAHFISGGMTLEKPASVRPSHTVLETPQLLSAWSALQPAFLNCYHPRHVLVLLYWAWTAPPTTLSLCLIP